MQVLHPHPPRKYKLAGWTWGFLGRPSHFLISTAKMLRHGTSFFVTCEPSHGCLFTLPLSCSPSEKSEASYVKCCCVWKVMMNFQTQSHSPIIVYLWVFLKGLDACSLHRSAEPRRQKLVSGIWGNGNAETLRPHYGLRVSETGTWASRGLSEQSGTQHLDFPSTNTTLKLLCDEWQESPTAWMLAFSGRKLG